MSPKNFEKAIMTKRLRVIDVMGVVALAAVGIVVGSGVPPATAEEIEKPPDVQSLRLEGSEGYVTFVDNSTNESAFRVIVVTNGEPSYSVASVEVPPNPGHGRVVTRQVSGMPSGQSVCASVTAVGPEPMPGTTNRYFLTSYGLTCADPANVPSDVALQNIRGNANPQTSASPAYLVELRNPGGTDATGVTVDISTSGVAALGDQAGVLGGWSANGFNCTTNSSTSMRCTGGNLKKGEQTAPAVIVGFTGPGFGAIHAQVSGAGDTNAGNNGTALNVNVS
jgi:hypothetical protein